ncbi:MAG TPA: enoyl-CoA hydratase/isomerase family protein [Candidatus Nitrosotalea sp.]|jgi:enoyl-CoA hydratase/carnithine racemase|nr:enoyl-CoA hydratase/isomerase family protein [Candidatus Nitrosotalea sp.]
MAKNDLSRPAVDLREDEGVWWITFNRPEASNAFTLADLDRLSEIFEEAGDRPRAAVLTGAGRTSFSAGMHLEAFSGLTPQRARDFIVENRRLLAAVRTAPFPTIAAINGHCLGTGLGLALVSDIRIAVPHATFGLPEIKVGVPSVCDIALLQQHIGLSKAKEVILTGDNYQVEELAPYGLLNAIVPADRLMTEARRMLGRLARHTRAVLAAQKKLFEIWQNNALSAGIDLSVDVFAGVFASTETYEQIERHRKAIGRQRRMAKDGPAGQPSGEAGLGV